MFAKTFVVVGAALAFTSPVLAGPIASTDLATRDIGAVAKRTGSFSFNNWGGFNSLNNFDSFFGADNFGGFLNQQVIVVEDSSSFFCQQQSIDIIQQRLFIIQELTKQLLLESLCEIEVQTIVLQQFLAGFSSFSNDLFCVSGRQIAFDQVIASQFSSIFNSDGSFNFNDLGFNGLSIGLNDVVVGGLSSVSQQNIFSARDATRLAGGLL